MKPIAESEFNKTMTRLGIQNLTTATIRQICALAGALEEISGEEFVRLELGNPGLMAETIGVEAECRALRNGVANKYPDVAGIPEIKKAGSDFIKAFLDLDVPPRCVVPTVGSMQACYTLMTLLKQRQPGRNAILFFDPGFPAQHHQAKMLGLKSVQFDIYDYRGEKLKDKLDELLKSGDITAMLYNNPNNPTWSNLTEEELKIIGEAATKYDVIVLEDLAYMGMDFRKDFSKPFETPFIPSVGKYTDNYILMISASKIFSYAGQRIAIVGMCPKVYDRVYPALVNFYEMPNFGDCFIYGVLYTNTSGVAHSAQYAMAEMMDKAVKAELPFVEHVREYGKRANRMKDIFNKYGFDIVYDKDGKEDISDGFFFTVGYKGMKSEELQKELLKYGVSTISLPCTGSKRDGIRVCVSIMKNDNLFNNLEERLKLFHDDHK